MTPEPGSIVTVLPNPRYPTREVRVGGVEQEVFPGGEMIDNIEAGFDVLPGTLCLVRGFAKIDKTKCPVVWVPSHGKSGWLWPYEVARVEESA